MIQLYRARLVLVVATILAVVVLATQLPLGELFHQRSQLSAAASELAVVDAHNRQLQSDVAALGRRSTIASIAHQEYGLVLAGQSAYVVLPVRSSGSGAARTAGPLALSPIPAVGLVAGDALALAGTRAGNASGLGAAPAASAKPAGSLWSRAIDRMAFWRWAF